MELPSNLPTPAPASWKNTKPPTPTHIVTYEGKNYKPPRVETDPINEGTAYYNTQHQKWLSNLHNQLKDTPNVKDICLQEILAINTQPVTHHDYLNKMANAIIDEDMGLAKD